MEPKEDTFFFDSYSVLPDKKEIRFCYKYRDLKFTETIFIPEAIPSSVNSVLLTKVLQNLHLILGISYYKMHCSKKIIIPYSLTPEQAQFWNTVYTKGLGEFFYRNKIDFRGLINFPYVDKPNIQPRRLSEAKKDRFLVGVGGGKDSIVVLELLKKEKKEITGLILETGGSHIQKEVARVVGIGFFLVKRQLDEKLFQLENIYKGHVPFSAIYAFIALLVSVIYDYSSIITANEKSSNFGNVNYLGEEINHQWSKSEEFEKLFKNYVEEFITPSIDYFSKLRKYSEMDIAKMFIKYKKYFFVFSSCNRNFIIKEKANKKWCGECPKCAFVFIMLAAYLSKKEVVKIFGKDLFNDESLISLYIDLIGKGKMKPFDCVGTFEESQQAFKIIKDKGEYDNDKVIKAIPL